MANETALQEARRRFNEVSERVRTDGDNWSEFLTCAARNHKYDFRDQLLIYDQRPNATACADIDLWNKRFSRWVNKGTKSVRLLSPDGQSVRHVFDITDTHPGFGHEFEEPPYVWKIEPEDLQDVSARLSEVYGESGSLGSQIAGIARNFALNLERRGDSLYASAGSDDDRRKLTDLLTDSVEYYLKIRCGLENRREDFSFENISELDRNTVMRLGTITSGFSRQVLDNVERVVRTNHERRLSNERIERAGDSLSSELHDERGIESGRSAGIRGIGDEAGGRPDDLSRRGFDGLGQRGLAGGESDEGIERRNDIREDSGHLDTVPNGEIETAVPAVDTIRTNEAEIFGRVESPDSVRVGRESADSLLGDTGTGEGNEKRADEPARESESSPRQRSRSDGLGAAHEQSGHASGRNSNGQSNLQLDLFDITNEQENIEEIENISHVSNIDNEIKDVKNINSDIDNIENTEDITTATKSKEINLIDTNLDLQPRQPQVRTHRHPRQNYRIKDDDLGVGGAKTKFKNNVEAIRTLKKIESEDRLATPEEQEILSRYVGWGGIPQAFDEKNDDWAKEYAELKELLTDEEL